MLITFLVNIFFFLVYFTDVASAYDYNFKSNLLFGANYNEINLNSPVNLNNKTNELYEFSHHLELRPDLKVTPLNPLELNIRPIFKNSVGNIPTDNKFKNKSDLWINEGFFSLKLTEPIKVHLGTQNYLWGPSEVVSPTNIFYEDLVNRPSPLFLLRGINMTRINYSPSQNISVVAMAQIKRTEHNHEDLKKILKIEFSSTEGDFSIGGTVATKEENNDTKSFGNYLSYTLNSTLHFYYEYKLDLKDDHTYPYYVGGIRYTFVDGTEIRNEYIYKDVTRNKIIPIEFNTLYYSDNYYFSLRKNADSFYHFLNPIFGIRVLHAMNNGSGLASTYLESGLNNYLTFTTYYGHAYGKDDLNYKLLIDNLLGMYITFSY